MKDSEYADTNDKSKCYDEQKLLKHSVYFANEGCQSEGGHIVIWENPNSFNKCDINAKFGMRSELKLNKVIYEGCQEDKARLYEIGELLQQ